MKILVDSSVWIDAFSLKPTIPAEKFRITMLEESIVTIRAIVNEVLAGAKSGTTFVTLKSGFDVLDHIDADWNAAPTWDSLLEIALFANKKKLSPTGVVDRMVLHCCQQSGSALWTLDRKLETLAAWLDVPIFSETAS